MSPPPFTWAPGFSLEPVALNLEAITKGEAVLPRIYPRMLTFCHTWKEAGRVNGTVHTVLETGQCFCPKPTPGGKTSKRRDERLPLPAGGREDITKALLQLSHKMSRKSTATCVPVTAGPTGIRGISQTHTDTQVPKNFTHTSDKLNNQRGPTLKCEQHTAKNAGFPGSKYLPQWWDKSGNSWWAGGSGGRADFGSSTVTVPPNGG